MSMQVKKLINCIKEAFKSWNDRDAFSASAVLAYYTIFSLPGLLVIIINVAGYFWGKEAVSREIMSQVEGMIGGDTATQVEDIIAKASVTKGTILSSVIGIASILFGATGVFYHVQQLFNKIWEVQPKPKQQFLKLLRDRLFSFGLILVIGFLLLVSLVVSAALSALSQWVAHHLSESLLVVFNILPDAKVQWRDVWVGALLTTVLFVIAKYALGLYFGKSQPGSTYGAAGSIILIMLWVSYASLVLLYGAEFTRTWAKHSGHAVQPTEIAKKAPEASATGFGSKSKS
jgi:membrane protein